MSFSQAAVASGSGLRKWTWSQITVGISVSIIVVAALGRLQCGQCSRRASAIPSRSFRRRNIVEVA
jgi:hypothetical protein